jgi:hypothetical protein
MNETSPFLLLAGVILLIFLAVGVFAAILVYLQRGQSRKQPEQSPAQAPLQPRARPAPVPVPEKPEETPSLSLGELPAHPGEVMRVLRDEQTGRTIIQVGEEQYAHIREIKDPQVGRRVLWAIADLIRFTGGMAANPQALRTIAQDTLPSRPGPEALLAEETPPQADRPSQPLAGGPREEQDTSPEASALLERLSRQEGGYGSGIEDLEAARGRGGIVDFFRRGFEAQPSSAAAPVSTSFIDEIEGILQARIRRLRAPLSQEVHVRTGADGTLQITVGVQVYPSPDQVPEPEIRQLIKSAVAEWEKR